MAYETLPDRVRAIANLSEFSRRSGIPRRTLVRVADGQRRPSLETCEKISAALSSLRPKKKPAPLAEPPAEPPTEPTAQPAADLLAA